MTNLAISYARFSSVGQGDGDSLRRQTEEAEKYAAENNLDLDRQRSFRDLGVSAYDQSNITKGALGLFLKAVEAEQIPIGTTLIIESFDRLSRASPIDALAVFTQLINSGLNVVTLTKPPKKFSRESIQANMFQLFEALMDMHRAHGESARKSDLVSSAWKDKKARAKAGEIMSGRAPHWIDVTVNPELDQKNPKKRSAKLNKERAKIVKRIVEQAELGIGNSTIIKTLHKDMVPAWSSSGKWEPSYVQKMLCSPALYGAIDIDGELIEGYYPAVIPKDRFLYLQALRSNRATTKNVNRKGKTVSNLFSGMLKCGYCGSSMNIAGYKSLKLGYERKYVGCHGARTASTGCKMKIWFLDELEPTLLFWLTTIDYSKLIGTGKKTSIDDEKTKLAGLENDLATTDLKIERTMIAIEEGATGMVPRLKQHEADKEKLLKLVSAQRDQVNALMSQDGGGSSRMGALLVIYKRLKDSTDEVALRELREKLSASINEKVERITLFPSGRKVGGEKDERFIEVEFKNGATRRIEPEEC